MGVAVAMNLKRAVMMALVALALVVAAFCLQGWAEGDVKITWQKETLYSADLSGVSLESVLEHLSDEEGIWFKVHNSVADHKVSVHFSELSLEEGLKRIFAGLDYSLEFDGEGNPCGIVIVGEKESVRGGAKGATAPRRVPVQRPVRRGPTGPEDPDEDDEDDEDVSPPVGGPYRPARPPVESPDDDFTPYGPAGGGGQAEHPKRIESPPSPDEADEMFSPYGPGDAFHPGKQKSVKRTRAPGSPDESAQEAGKGLEESQEDPDTPGP